MAGILEVKHTLDGEQRTYPSTLLDAGEGFAAILYVLPESARVDDLDLPAGTATVAYYWADRPYNLYHWVDPAGRTLAFYFNLARATAITPGQIEWWDLAADVLVTPDGRVRVLDEDEVPVEVEPEVARARAALERDLPDLLAAVEPSSRRYLARAERQ